MIYDLRGRRNLNRCPVCIVKFDPPLKLIVEVGTLSCTEVKKHIFILQHHPQGKLNGRKGGREDGWMGGWMDEAGSRAQKGILGRAECEHEDSRQERHVQGTDGNIKAAGRAVGLKIKKRQGSGLEP